MSIISYIREDDVSRYEGLKKVSNLNRMEDVATLMETYRDVRGKIGYERIKYVVEDDEGYYYFVISNKVEDFDIFKFINEVYVNKGIRVSCLNANALFPEKDSRGIYNDEGSENEDATSEQDIPTGYLDEASLPNMDKGVPYLLWERTGNNIVVPEGGLVLGRSSNKVDYIIKDNINVGRVHCKVYVNKGKLMVHDYDSTNGTFVNNRRVSSSRDVELTSGDTLLLADEKFRVVQ